MVTNRQISTNRLDSLAKDQTQLREFAKVLVPHRYVSTVLSEILIDILRAAADNWQQLVLYYQAEYVLLLINFRTAHPQYNVSEYSSDQRTCNYAYFSRVYIDALLECKTCDEY